MKLRNKKTGEIVMVCKINPEPYEARDFECSSLAELNEEWEDYEEPKEYWCIDWTGGINHITILDDSTDEYENDKKAIGNYFETKEEAELAVRKLKAWKRLKDKCGISFSGVNRNIKGRPVSVNLDFNIEGRTTFDDAIQNTEDLMLLFGGNNESN